MVTTQQDGDWATIKGTASEIISELNSNDASKEQVRGITSTGSEINVLYWNAEV